VLRQTTWPSRSYLIALIASLVTGWLFISISSRLIRNRPIRRVVRWSALAFLTLYLLGLLPEATAVLDGVAVSFGDFRVSALLVVKTIATLGVLIALASWLSAEGGRRIADAEDLSPSLRVLAEKSLTLLLFGVAIVLGLQSAGFDLTTLTVLSGAIGLGLGFGLQKVVSNLVSGIILLLDKSIKPGDVISLGETFGWISSLGARYVSVVTRDGREYLIPNEDLITGQVVNWSHSSDLVRLDIFFGVSYASDPHERRRRPCAISSGSATVPSTSSSASGSATLRAG
jgi:small-conductance mechanosensitive channel